MNALAQQLFGVCKKYLGPAAGPFLHAELATFGSDANRIETRQLGEFASAALPRAAQLMGQGKAAEFRAALLACAELPRAKPVAGGERLASDAASTLLARGKPREAAVAYAELATRHGDVESYRGLAKALVTAGERESAARALREGAAARLRLHDRAGELELLSEAVLTAPTDLGAHRRLAAALANGSDLAGACAEYRRFIDAVLAQGDARRALLELAYGREILGELPELLALVDRITARSAPGRAHPVDEPRSSAARKSAAAPKTAEAMPSGSLYARTAAAASHAADKNEPIDFEKAAALRRRLRNTLPSDDVEAILASLAVAGPEDDAAIAYGRASVLIAGRDPRASDATIDAAKRLLDRGNTRAAADVLLAFVNETSSALQAHLLLADVARRLGREDIAAEKQRLVLTLAGIGNDDQAARAAASSSAASAAASTAPLVGAAALQRALPSRTA